MRLVCLLVLTSLGACATTGSTYRSGVGDKLLEHPPYYAGATPQSTDTGRIAHFPIAYQAGSTQPPMFEPGNSAGSPIAMLLADMNAYLDSLGLTTRMSSVPSKGTPPDVRFSCETPPAGPEDECATGDGALGRDDIVMKLAAGRPSADWTTNAATALERASASTALVTHWRSASTVFASEACAAIRKSTWARGTSRRSPGSPLSRHQFQCCN